MSENRRCFLLGIQILHSLFVEFDGSLSIEYFIGDVIRAIRNIKSTVIDLYPKRLSGIISILEEPPSAKLAGNILLMLDSAFDAQLVCSEELLMLTTHFQEWKSTMDEFLQQQPAKTRMLQMYIKSMT
ncbi:hypothetical protein CHUAL_014082 [Chamberlinius hualienensis]